MKTKIIISSLLILGCVFMVSAQSIERQVISATGGSSISTTVIMDYTVGEAAIGTFGNSSITVTQGFHQTSVTGIGISDMDVNSVLIVYPNPTSSLLNVKFADAQKAEDYKLSVVSLTGVTVLEFKNLSNIGLAQTLVLDVSNLASSGYMLLIVNTKTGSRNHLIFEKVN